MISETTFANRYTSFWRELLPNSDRAIRRINLSVERFCMPVRELSAADRRGYINEVAFAVFSSSFSSETNSFEKLTKIQMSEIYKNVRKQLLKYKGIENKQVVRPRASEAPEVTALISNLKQIKEIKQFNGKMITAPNFDGCGFIDGCRGDLLIGKSIIEVKAGDRNFRSTDFRQLLVYLALNYLSKQYVLDEVGLVNPRLGTFVVMPVDNMCMEMGGRSGAELLSDIVYYASSGDISV